MRRLLSSPVLKSKPRFFDRSCVELLMRAGAIVDAKDRVGVSALIAASYNGHVDCVRNLLKYAADVNAQSHGGVTPLIAAAEGGSESCVRLLIEVR